MEPIDTERAELEAMRRRIDALERDQHERTARANQALARAQDRAYWLDRWNLDLNELMRRRGAGELRAGLRAGRKVYRVLNDGRHRLQDHARDLPLRLRLAHTAMDEERARSSEPQPDAFPRTLSPDPLPDAPVTDVLHARLSDSDLDTIADRLAPAEQALWETAQGPERKRLALAFAAHYGVQPALQRSGLSADMPPAGIHSMAHGPTAAGGSTYYADLVVDALRRSGMELRPGMRGLDFGCSSGRVVRVLAAAFPDVEWHGCDPIPDAIEWARAQLPAITFTRSDESPPLPHGDATLDFAFAISIWSHFAEQSALDWFHELRRVLRPGGRLVVTTHGLHSVTHTNRAGLRSLDQLTDVREALFERGFWYAPEFGEQGDHGIVNADWGTAFLSPEWLLAKLTPAWRVMLFAPGRVEANQDLYVLERS